MHRYVINLQDLTSGVAVPTDPHPLPWTFLGRECTVFYQSTPVFWVQNLTSLSPHVRNERETTFDNWSQLSLKTTLDSDLQSFRYIFRSGFVLKEVKIFEQSSMEMSFSLSDTSDLCIIDSSILFHLYCTNHYRIVMITHCGLNSSSVLSTFLYKTKKTGEKRWVFSPRFRGERGLGAPHFLYCVTWTDRFRSNAKLPH